MRIAYVLIWNIDGHSAIEKKVQNQIVTWRKFKHDVKLFIVSRSTFDNKLDDGVLIKKRSGSFVFQYFYNWYSYKRLSEEVNNFNPEFLYIRNSFYHSSLRSLANKYPSCIEVNGLPVEENTLGRWRNFNKIFLSIYLKFTVKKMLSVAHGKICVTNEIAHKLYSSYDQRKIKVIPNSINIKKTKYVEPGLSKIPKIAFVCGLTGERTYRSQSHYHGLDKVISLAHQTIGKLHFIVIGVTPRKHEDIPSNMDFLGFLSGDSYQKALESADVGLGVSALHRKNMNEASPLRVRDYIASGLPIIIPYEETSFICHDQTPSWALVLPNKESNLEENVTSIIDFSRRMKGSRIPLEEAENYFGSDHWENERIEFMKFIRKTVIDEV